MTRFVAYYRVSTAKQGASGLGLEAQQEAVRRFLQGAEPFEAFTEVESGRANDRPQLAAALLACRLSGARLIVAKLDRLSRNMAFLAALMDSGVEFVCCDNPTANRVTLHVLAALAEHERSMISTRTKEALAAAKARGVALGGLRHDLGQYAAKASNASAAQRRAKAKASAQDLAAAVAQMRATLGADASLAALAGALNARGRHTPRGAKITPATIWRALRAAV